MRKLIIHSKHEDYFGKVVDTIRQSKRKVCYITFNKGYEASEKELSQKGISREKLFFIDAITKDLGQSKKTNNCDFVSAPDRLDLISDSVKNALKKGCKLVVLDSLSNLLDHYSENSSQEKIVLEFLKSFSEETKRLEVVFIVREADVENKIIQESLPFFKTYDKDFVPLGF